MKISSLHHVAIICSQYERSKFFYTKVLGLEILRETFREERNSYKLDLKLDEGGAIELFSFPSPPPRVSSPEAAGLRHLSFKVSDLSSTIFHLRRHDVEVEPVRTDELTGKKFTFFKDPDGLPLELYEV